MLLIVKMKLKSSGIYMMIARSHEYHKKGRRKKLLILTVICYSIGAKSKIQINQNLQRSKRNDNINLKQFNLTSN